MSVPIANVSLLLIDVEGQLKSVQIKYTRLPLKLFGHLTNVWCIPIPMVNLGVIGPPGLVSRRSLVSPKMKIANSQKHVRLAHLTVRMTNTH